MKNFLLFLLASTVAVFAADPEVRNVPVVPTSRQVIAGTGLSGGGALTADRTLSVTTNSLQQRVWVKIGSTNIGVFDVVDFWPGSNITITTTNRGGTNLDILITATSGGGGLATTDIDTLAELNTIVGDANLVPEVRSISTGAGLTGGGDLSANRTFVVDLSTLVANQTLWDGANASRTFTFNLSGTDPVLTFSSGSIDVTTGTLKQSGNAVISTSPSGSSGAFAIYTGSAVTAPSTNATINATGDASFNTLTTGGGTVRTNGSFTWFGSGDGIGFTITNSANGNYRWALPASGLSGAYTFSITGSNVTLTAAVTASSTDTLTNKKLSHSTLGTDDTYTGIEITGFNNSGGVTQWDAVYLNSSSQWVLADANGSGTYPARGLATATVATGNATTVVVQGVIRNDAWNWTPGGTIYLSTTAGGLTQTVPNTTGDKIQTMGYALDADTIRLFPSGDWGTSP